MLARVGTLPLIAAVRSKGDLEADLPNPEGAPVTVLPSRTVIRASCPSWKSSEVRPVGAAPKAQALVSQTSECHPGNRSRKSRRAPARRAGPRTHRTP